jgi:hypothetical protein
MSRTSISSLRRICRSLVNSLGERYHLIADCAVGSQQSVTEVKLNVEGRAWQAVITENSVRSENTGVPIIREIMMATTMNSLFVAFSLW